MMAAPPVNIIEEIKRYVPGITANNSTHGVQRIGIQLLGFVGNGKSSLINSCMCVVKNETYRNLAGAGKDEGGRTTKRTSHQLTDTICITDNRGFNKMAPEEILEVCGQLRHLRLEGNVDWDKDNLKETLRCIPQVNKRTRELILPVIVHSCLYVFKEDEENSMRELIKKCQDITGIPPIVVITNVGPPNTRPGNGTAMETRFGNMGCTHRICLENYTENMPTRIPEADNQFLNFLKVCIDEAEHIIKPRVNLDDREIFAKRVVDQIEEENEVKDQRSRRELEESNNEVRRMEERRWYQQCSIL